MQQNKAGELSLFNPFGRFSILLLLYVSLLYSGSFENFKNFQINSFKKYNDKNDDIFSSYLKQQWGAYEVQKGKSLYQKEKPEFLAPAKVLKPKSVGPKVSLNIKSIDTIEDRKIISKKVLDIVVVKKSEAKKSLKNSINFNFFGSKLNFNISADIKNAKFYPRNQKGITNFFASMASSEYENLIYDIGRVSKMMKLNDWGIYLLVSKISENIYSNSDDKKLLSWFIFNKLGYAVKVGLNKKHIVLMHYSKKIIYATPSYSFNKKNFYVISNYAKSRLGRVYSYRQNYPNANKSLDLSLDLLPNFVLDKKTKILKFKQFGKNYSLSFDYNRNLIDFMATYPQADYKTYFNAPLENETYKSIVFGLKKYLDGKQSSEAINFVLHFVQNSFKYQRDKEHFSREKVMFAEETLFYDKSDCEDRAILFSYLIKELFGISVVGVKYKDHMSTALYIPIEGDSVKVKKKRFIIADPTYINANVGQNMPKYKSTRPESFITLR